MHLPLVVSIPADSLGYISAALSASIQHDDGDRCLVCGAKSIKITFEKSVQKQCLGD